MNFKFLLGIFVIVGLIVSPYYTNDIFAEEENSVIVSTSLNMVNIQWFEASYPASGTGHVRVIDPDMNLDPKAVDNFDVDVWSDTDFAGIDLTVTETGASTGIFEGTVFFSTTDHSSGHRLRVGNGDTIYSKYEDNTLPDSHTKNHLDVISTASIQGTPNSIIDDRVSLDKKSYSWTDKVYVNIIAPEHNLDSNLIEKIDASEQYRVTVTTRYFEIDDYQLVETDIDSGIFTGEIILNENEFYDINSTGNDGISVLFEYVDDKVAIGSATIIGNSFETVDDAPFFGIFVYLDNLISWIFGNPSQSETINESEQMERNYHMTTDKSRMTFGEFLRVDIEIDSPVTAPHEIRVVGPDGKSHAITSAETDDKHSWAFQAKENWPRGTYEIQLWHFDEKAIMSTFILQKSKTNSDFDNIDPKTKNELQSSHDLVLLGKTVTIFGNISNPETEYVIIRIFNENVGEMDRSRITLDDTGFYKYEIKIRSNWPLGTYSVTLAPSEFDSVVYFDVLGTEETWEEINKAIQNFD